MPNAVSSYATRFLAACGWDLNETSAIQASGDSEMISAKPFLRRVAISVMNEPSVT